MSEHGKDVLALLILAAACAAVLSGIAVGISIDAGVWWAGPLVLVGFAAFGATAWAFNRIFGDSFRWY